jgi:hypothetical protein
MAVFEALHPVAAIDPGGAIGQRHVGNLPFLAKLEPGQHLRATVQAALSNGEFAVMLHQPDGLASDGPVLHMRLPAGARPGDILNLILVARLPKLEFALAADTPLNAEPPSPPLRLSGTGRFIDDLLRRPVFPDSPALSRNTPLLGKPPEKGLELSLQLAQAVGRSGLFYESHQAQWIAGARPFSELLREPQVHLARSELTTWNTDMSEANVRAIAGAAGPAVAGASHVLEPTHSDGDSSHPHSSPAGPVHRDTVALVRQQLEVLETRHVTWQGEAWPGQAIALEIFEEDNRTPNERDDANQIYALPWKTCLSLNLPNLGQVTANLRLYREGLEVSFSAPDHATTAVLRAGVAALAHGLEGAGIKLLGMGVNVREEQD